jgi:hypothetical protein
MSCELRVTKFETFFEAREGYDDIIQGLVDVVPRTLWREW